MLDANRLGGDGRTRVKRPPMFLNRENILKVRFADARVPRRGTEKNVEKISRVQILVGIVGGVV